MQANAFNTKEQILRAYNQFCKDQHIKQNSYIFPLDQDNQYKQQFINYLKQIDQQYLYDQYRLEEEQLINNELFNNDLNDSLNNDQNNFQWSDNITQNNYEQQFIDIQNQITDIQLKQNELSLAFTQFQNSIQYQLNQMRQQFMNEIQNMKNETKKRQYLQGKFDRIQPRVSQLFRKQTQRIILRSNIQTLMDHFIECKQSIESNIMQNYCTQQGIIYQENILPSFQINIKQNTPAMWLAQSNIKPNRKYQHDPSLQNIHGYTVSLIFARRGQKPQQQWNHDKFLRAKIYFKRDSATNVPEYKYYTVYNFLQDNKKVDLSNWSYKPLNQDEDNQEIIQAKQNIVPHPNNNQSYQNILGQTVAMCLADNRIIPKQEWSHNPLLENYRGWTVALILASNGILPPQLWSHNKFKRVPLPSQIDEKLEFYTVQNLLQMTGQQVTEIWKYNPLNDDEDNDQIITAKNGVIPQVNDQNQVILSSYQNKKGWTVAMVLASKGIIPPKEWYHDNYLQNENGQTVAMILADNNIPIDQFWEHDPQIQDVKGNTVAMLLAKNGSSIPSKWQHSPEIKNSDDYTVAFYLAQRGIIPKQKWYHDKLQRFVYTPKRSNRCYYYTIKNILEEKNVQVPNIWNYVSIDKDENTEQMADILKGKDQAELIQCSPTLRNKKGDTVAIILAKKGIIPNVDWLHDKYLQNNHGQTVAFLLSQNGIVPSSDWMTDIDQRYENDTTIRSNLEKFGYSFDNYDKPQYQNYALVEMDDICEICFTGAKQYFIHAKCPHKICIGCFKELINAGSQNSCPICRKQNWYVTK